ncbi:MAG: biotin/lipoyl-binding protein [Clostridiales bacterium]|nr:biotin/lipoyl-binding protein [Clostridiales bacterium]
MKKAKVLSMLLTGAIALSLTSCYFLPDEEEVLKPPTVAGESARYTTVTAAKRDLVKTLFATGMLVSEVETYAYFSGISGKLLSIDVNSGDTVKAGDVLCTLDTSDIDIEINEKELYIKRAKLEKQILENQSAMQAEIDKKQVDVDILQSELNKLVARKDGAKLKSPINGLVSNIREISVGDYIEADIAIATIIDPSTVYMSVKPTDYLPYKNGTELDIKVKDEIYDGVVFMNPNELPDQIPKEGIQYERDCVYIRFKGAPPQGIVGQLADSILLLDERKDVVVIANNLIKTINGESVVYVLKDDVKEAVSVEIGLKTGSFSEITSGINEGDIIVIR